jgi:hypothetical protein
VFGRLWRTGVKVRTVTDRTKRELDPNGPTLQEVLQRELYQKGRSDGDIN